MPANSFMVDQQLQTMWNDDVERRCGTTMDAGTIGVNVDLIRPLNYKKMAVAKGVMGFMFTEVKFMLLKHFFYVYDDRSVIVQR
ncbi:hypothetical protein Tco_1293959 [Tanacetum coccineum]